jgi:hypothetical protein
MNKIIHSLPPWASLTGPWSATYRPWASFERSRTRGQDYRREVLAEPVTLGHRVRGQDLRALLVAVKTWAEAPAEIEARLMLGAAPAALPARLDAARRVLDRGFREIAGWLGDKGLAWVQEYGI